MNKKYQVHIIDEFGEQKTLEYASMEYRNLMELVVNESYEEWGDCKGRAWCGTCHVAVEIGDEEAIPEKEKPEKIKLEELTNTTPTSRLACQITVDETIHNMTFKILKDE